MLFYNSRITVKPWASCNFHFSFEFSVGVCHNRNIFKCDTFSQMTLNPVSHVLVLTLNSNLFDQQWPYKREIWIAENVYFYSVIFRTNIRQILPASIYLFKVSNRNIGEKMWNTFKFNSKNARTRSLTSFYCFCCWLWTCFTPFSSVSFFTLNKKQLTG